MRLKKTLRRLKVSNFRIRKMADPNKKLKVESVMQNIPAEHSRLVARKIDLFKRMCCSDKEFKFSLFIKR